MNAARRALRAVTATGLAAATTAVSVPSLYLTVISIAGLLARPRRSPLTRPTTSFAILVPAHDEALVIGEALAAFEQLDYPSELVSVHVVADNCTDATADVVRHSRWSVHERCVPDEPGKGPALNWLVDRLARLDQIYDAAVIIDADTTVDRGFLRAMDGAYRGGAIAAQGYYSVREPDPSPATSFRFAALACRHRLRPLGRCRIGGSCGLYGNGMMFDRGLLMSRRWSGHLVEDAEFQNELLLDGHLVTYVADAHLWAEMPHTKEQATTQHERWEQGRIDIARRYIPRLMAATRNQAGHRVADADAVLDHLVPPLTVLVAFQILVGGLAAAASIGGRRTPRICLAIDGVAFVAVGAHTVAGLASARADRRHYRALLAAPAQIVWKSRLWLSVLSGRREVRWTRTGRNAERRPMASQVEER